VNNLNSNEQKQIMRKRREKNFRLWLTTLSWTMPVIAFGSFFSVWHNISNTVNPTIKSKPSVSVVTHHPIDHQLAKSVTPSVLFKIGSRSPQVSAIQDQLYELGYFDHVITEYYGPVTAQAVESFQLAQHLNATGKIDSSTLNALKQAVKLNQTSNLVSSSAPSSASQTIPQPGSSQSPSNVAASQQSIPQTSSSAS
jgi:peptidoglycan hydrolase-like protein with peptidoglycan-binding domain